MSDYVQHAASAIERQLPLMSDQESARLSLRIARHLDEMGLFHSAYLRDGVDELRKSAMTAAALSPASSPQRAAYRQTANYCADLIDDGHE